MMTIAVDVCGEFGLTVSEAKAETMCMRSEEYGDVRFEINGASKIHKQTNKVVYLGECIRSIPDLFVEIVRRTQRAWAFYRKYGLHFYDQRSADLKLKDWMLKVEVVLTLLYRSVSWMPPKITKIYYAEPTPSYSTASLTGASKTVRTMSFLTERASQERAAKA